MLHHLFRIKCPTYCISSSVQNLEVQYIVQTLKGHVLKLCMQCNKAYKFLKILPVLGGCSIPETSFYENFVSLVKILKPLTWQ